MMINDASEKYIFFMGIDQVLNSELFFFIFICIIVFINSLGCNISFSIFIISKIVEIQNLFYYLRKKNSIKLQLDILLFNLTCKNL